MSREIFSLLSAEVSAVAEVAQTREKGVQDKAVLYSMLDCLISCVQPSAVLHSNGLLNTSVSLRPRLEVLIVRNVRSRRTSARATLGHTTATAAWFRGAEAVATA